MPIVTIDKTLENLKDKPLFQEKVDKANETLKECWRAKVKAGDIILSLCFFRNFAQK